MTSLVGCHHGEPGRPQACPPMCPVQQWPRYLFRVGLFRGDWVLRRRYRHLRAESLMRAEAAA